MYMACHTVLTNFHAMAMQSKSASLEGEGLWQAHYGELTIVRQ